LRVIDENGKVAGIFERREAISFARDRGYDLVLVAPNSQPPIAKLLDFGKLKYEREKAIQKQKQKTKGLKEIRISLKISKHDLDIKISRAIKFLEKGYKVRINLKLKGREMQFKEKAFELLEKIIDNLAKIAEIEIQPFQERNQFSVQLKPKIEK